MEYTIDKLKQMSGPGRIVSANKHALAAMQDGIKWAVQEIERITAMYEECRADAIAMRAELEWYANEAEEEARKFHFGTVKSNIGNRAREALKCSP